MFAQIRRTRRKTPALKGGALRRIDIKEYNRIYTA